jgi:hypothetical protein
MAKAARLAAEGGFAHFDFWENFVTIGERPTEQAAAKIAFIRGLAGGRTRTSEGSNQALKRIKEPPISLGFAAV